MRSNIEVFDVLWYLFCLIEILSLEWKMRSIFHSAGYWTYCLTWWWEVFFMTFLYMSVDASSQKVKANKRNLLFAANYTIRMTGNNYFFRKSHAFRQRRNNKFVLVCKSLIYISTPETECYSLFPAYGKQCCFLFLFLFFVITSNLPL